jgi:hypothetical protein
MPEHPAATRTPIAYSLLQSLQLLLLLLLVLPDPATLPIIRHNAVHTPHTPQPDAAVSPAAGL